jgi:osmotically-inducible protein OsmY
MRRKLPLHGLILATVLGGPLSACAGFASYRSCGYHECPADAAISSAVRAALDQHAELRAPNRLYVQTLDRVVYLTGEVSTELQRDIAGSVAGSTPGARRVVNDVSLEYTGR